MPARYRPHLFEVQFENIPAMSDKLYLIDGHALIFKMYYAFLRHPMINSKGADMSILYGFTKYILEMAGKENPTHLAVSFDPPGGTFRNKIFPEYKATRAETPRPVIDALEPLTEICHALHIPVLMKPGYEADDVIGTVASRFGKDGTDVYMVTPDKDYGQLINKHVFQYKPGKSGSDSEIIDCAAICSKYGIDNPLQVIEMLTICGDTADNVPGVKGVGEVGAGKLIAKYGTVDNIYAHIQELTPRQQQLFTDAKDHISLSHELVTIKTDVPVDITLDEMALRIEYTPEIADLFEKYEFPSLLKHLGDKHTASKQNSAIEISYKEVTASELTQAAIKAGSCSIVVEGEESGIFSNIRKITAAVKEENGCIAAEGQAADFSEILGNRTVAKYGYNLKPQYNLLIHSDINPKGKLLDIELMHYLIDPEKSHKLDILTKSYLGVNLEEEEKVEEIAELSLFEDKETNNDTPQFRLAAILALLGKTVAEDLSQSGLRDLYDSIEEPLISVLARMERNGVKVDLRQLELFAEDLRHEMNALELEIREIADDPSLNISSPKQIGILIFEKLGLDPKAKKSAKGSWTTDESTLSALADRHPVVNKILEFRAVKKLLSTYIEPFPKYVSQLTGKIHTTFNQALTSTGRLSSSNPNLQNIPIRTERGKEIRKAFVPSREGNVIVSADYSQIELRIMAHLSQDAHLVKAFRDGMDIHSATAAKIFGIPVEEVNSDQRRIAKTANFGIMYGISAFGLAERLHISRSEAKKIIDDYFTAFPAIRSFIDDTLVSARENGFVETIFGRRRYIPDINSTNATVRSLAERNAVNAPIQGTAADIIKMAMIAIDKELQTSSMTSQMVLQIHDELLFDTPENEVTRLKEMIVRCMENIVNLSIPLTVDCNYGKNWLEAH